MLAFRTNDHDVAGLTLFRGCKRCQPNNSPHRDRLNVTPVCRSQLGKALIDCKSGLCVGFKMKAMNSYDSNDSIHLSLRLLTVTPEVHVQNRACKTSFINVLTTLTAFCFSMWLCSHTDRGRTLAEGSAPSTGGIQSHLARYVMLIGLSV